MISWPQLLLFLIVAVGLGLLISASMGLRSGHIEKYVDEEGRPAYRRHRHFRWGRGLGGVVLLVLALTLLWTALQVQSYIGLTGDVQVARIHATQITNAQHLMSVELMLYDNNGHQNSTNTYMVNGDEWMLQGNIIKFSPWLNILGLHSSYKLTRLEGRFDDPNLERNSQHTVVELNGGDDNFFKTTQNLPWVSPFVEATFGGGTFLQPDGRTYDVFIASNGLLYPKPAK
jgi:hypothetical protein